MIHPPRGSWFFAGSETPKASQSLAARYLGPQRDNLPGAHTYVACEFTLCLPTTRLRVFQQGLVRLIYLLEALLSLGIFIDVWVVLEGQPAESPPDLLIRGGLPYAQNLIVDTHIIRATCSHLQTLLIPLRHDTYPRASTIASPTSAVLAVPPRSGVKLAPSSRILRTVRSMADAAASSPMNRSIIAPDMIAAMGFAIP